LSFTVSRVGANAAVGTVLGTRPAAGTTWPQTKPVTIRVAGGPAVPNFSGQTLQVAQQWASAHGANLQQQQDQNSQLPQGTITGQEPSAGSLYQQGETVVVNAHGGLLMMKHEIDNGEMIVLTNPETLEEQECRVVYLGDTSEKGTRVGVEFLSPSPHFWGVEFAPQDWPGKLVNRPTH